jgi:predicted phage terminase large subunit-like protein
LQAAAAELLKRRRARANLLDFVTYTMPEYEVNWHHRLMCEHLDKFVTGEIKRLMIFTPPRMGKSQLVSRHLPAFLLGRDPTTTIIAASYGADLARRMNRDVQRIIDSEAYRQVFPKTQLFGANIRTVAQGTWLRNSDMFEVVEYGGYYRSTGIGGAITGLGAKYAIIDDVLKNRAEASSPTIRENIWEWYTSTFRTRLAPEAGVMITVTRWHEADLPGKLLDLAKSDNRADQWEVISLPAIAEEPIAPYDPRKPGDLLWPSWFSQEEMERTRVSLGSYDWASLYQQRPAPDEGGIFKRHWWRYWQPAGGKLPPVQVRTDDGMMEIAPVDLPARFDTQLQSWDCAFKATADSDYVAGQVWGKSGANKYMLDYYQERADIVQTMKTIENMTGKWPEAITKLIEDKANGPAVIQMLHNKIAGLIAIDPQGGKISRAYAVQPEVEAGNVYLPHPALCSWTNRFIESCAAFPNAAHDDDVDSFTQAMSRMRQSGWVRGAAA